MTLPLWGLLQKSQDDISTIDEAIAAAVVAHEEDPTAHLGAGESLQSHKSEEIIDHPPVSVVADKIPDRSVTPEKFNISTFYYQTSFDSLDGWTTALYPGDSYFRLFPSILDFRTGADNDAYVRLSRVTPFRIYGPSNPYFQFLLRGDSVEVERVNFAAGFTNSSDALSPAADGFSFFWDGFALKLYARVTDGGVNTDTEIFADFSAEWVLFRAEFDYTESEIRFYINSTLVHTADASLLNIDFEYLFSASSAAWVALPADMFMGNLIVGHS